MNEVKIKPTKEQKFKEFKVTTKNWNLDTRKKINQLYSFAVDPNNEMSEFDACCEIIALSTTLTEDEVFNLSAEEINNIGFQINKKK